MPTGCCGQATCSCKIETGDGPLGVSGSGQPGDPFIFDLELARSSTHNITFDTLSAGEGSTADPWTVETHFAPTAKLDHLPDVNVPSPANGQVLAWNTATNQWVAAAPTVAPTGAVSHDTSLSGDGSPATPLGVTPVTARLFGTFPTGVGLNDQGMVSVVQHFMGSGQRATTIPLPTLNQLTMLDSNPGVVDYWNGTAWVPQVGQVSWTTSDEFLELSGPYSGGPVQVQTLQVSTTTDAVGVFDVLTVAALTGRSGVLTCLIQETGSQPWKAMPYPNTNKVSATAYRITDGSVMSAQPVTAMVMAITY